MEQAYLASMMAVVLTRAGERILLVLVGALAIYLGYSLFRHIPNATRGSHLGEGKIELPGGVSIFLTRIGPGVFFALFGIAVIGYSVTKPVQFSFPPVAGATASSGAGATYSGAVQSAQIAAPAPTVPASGPEPEIVVAKLNGVYQDVQKRMSGPAAAELAAAVRSAKFAVMLGGWKKDWGDRDAFERWVRANGDKDPPPDLVPGATPVFHAVLP
jgi:branched-subunit amino acid transport protein